MQENPPNPESNIKSAIDAATGLVKAVPIYQDVVQPSAKQIGESLSIITKTVNIALAPLKAIVWGYDKIEEFITLKISEKLKDIPPEKITTPPLQVAGPSADALRYVGHNENLRELFANLIATSMNIDTVHKAHPAYVDIIKNLTSDEAILLTAFAKADSYPCIEVQSKVKSTNDYHVIQKSFSNLHNIASMSMPELLPSYLDNLCRLGIIEILKGIHYSNIAKYDPLINSPVIKTIQKEVEILGRELRLEKGIINVTSFGKHFVEGVISIS